MSTTPVGLSAGSKKYLSRPMVCNTTGLKEGACVIYDSSAIKGACKAPTAAGNTGFAGVIVGQQASTGTTSGDTVEVAYSGIVPVLLDAGQAVTVGGKVQISDTDGSVKALGTTDSCDIVGVTQQTLTAGSANDLIEVLLQPQFTGDTVP